MVLVLFATLFIDPCTYVVFAEMGWQACLFCHGIDSEKIPMIIIVVCQVAEGLQYSQWFWCIVLDNDRAFPRSRHGLDDLTFDQLHAGAAPFSDVIVAIQHDRW
jgi:hypothetical protein